MNNNTNKDTNINGTQTQAQNIILCADCGKPINTDTDEHWTIANGDIVCNDCIDGCFYCDECGEYFHWDTGRLVRNRQNEKVYVCDDCLDSYYCCCEECDNYYHRDNIANVDGVNVCDDCLENCYYRCDECGEYVHESDAHEINGRYYCDTCYGDRKIIQSYHSHKSGLPVFHKEKWEKLSDALFLGFELETADYDNDDDVYECAKDIVEGYGDSEKNFYIEKDGSLDCGFELISQPRTLTSHKKYNWDNVFETILNWGGRSHDTRCCGLHVHINKDYLTRTERRKLDLFIHRTQKQWEKIARRKHNGYAKFGFVDEDLRIAWKYLARSTCDRYRALNFENCETIEFRLFKGTLKYSTFMATLELVDAVCHYVKQRNILQCDKGNWSDFTLFLKQNNNKKQYANAIVYAKAKHLA